jgi:NAD(P)-dependent dehydrogenase (short-subunit alcohol dehydrogenase family)
MPFRSILTLLVVVIALAFKPMVFPLLLRKNLAPTDDSIGAISVLDITELSKAYNGKRALLIGGTRGVGYGTALAIAQAGADITLVGRSPKSGEAALDKIRAKAKIQNEQRLEFVQGDLGSLASVNELVETLASRPEKYDFLVLTAMTFPDWSAPSTANVDGFDQSYFIGVIGRFIIYRNMHRFLRGQHPRVLNVFASGEKPLAQVDRELAKGNREPTSLFNVLSTSAVMNEIMLIGLMEKDPNVSGKVTLVSTHPGMLKTDLHRGQAWWFDVIEAIVVSLAGVNEEECGIRQASILASDKLHVGNLSYVDMFMEGRERSPELQTELDANLEWEWSLLTHLEAKSKVEKENQLDS